MSFSSFGLSAALINALSELKLSQATPIQQQMIPVLLAGRDVIGLGQTGSGKTLAYCLPLLQHYLQAEPRRNRDIQSLILVPTRELAQQVGATLRQLTQAMTRPPRLAILFGGVSINPQMLHLRGGADIVVATPGRLLDLQRNNAVQLAALKHLVIDEADRLLDLGFSEELNQVFDLIPASRQTCLCSATFAAALSTVCARVLRQPLRIDLTFEAENHPIITQRAILVEAAQRTQLLRHLIEQHNWASVLVFVASKFAADKLAEKLRRYQFRAEAFHGDQSQGKRQQVLSDFKNQRLEIVIATDIAARGIDIEQLDVVVNFDLPRSADDYTHRIGRTGRAGATGLAISLVCADSANQAHFRLLQKRQGSQLELETLAGFIPSQPEAVAEKTNSMHDGNGGIKGKRPNKKDKLRALGLR